MKKFVNIYKIIIILLIIIIVIGCTCYNYAISPTSKVSKEVELEIAENSTYLSIANELKEKGLIRSINFYKIYVKIFSPQNLQKGKYILNQNMGVKKIIEKLEEGNNYNPDTIKITFNEGINMRAIAKVITDNTNNTIDMVFDKLKDSKYLDSLIKKYWFVGEEIKNSEIYYSLEGYLFPDTYEFLNKDVTVEEIFEKMLDKMELVLNQYKELLDSSKYSIHDILTLASIVELEGAGSNDRNSVAGVFYNRLKNNWSLGSDVTTYYASKVDMSERDLYQKELDAFNAYNTRSSSMAGKLPVGPICIPSSQSIEAVLKPTSHDYFYFVADKNKKTYFSKTYTEHNATINKLKRDNLWYNY